MEGKINLHINNLISSHTDLEGKHFAKHMYIYVSDGHPSVLHSTEHYLNRFVDLKYPSVHKISEIALFLP
jgi:hypothetical protein